MARPLRIQYPNAWYHVLNRGRRKENIFTSSSDYSRFVELLKETAELWNLRIAAYCLMPNHYHLLVQTPDANISRCMRHIDGVYTQRFNRSHKSDGALFRGRYKSIVIDADNYLLKLVRYIHRNPIKAGLTDQLNQYAWSSHMGYLSKSEKWNWLHKDFILSIISQTKSDQIRDYRRFVCADPEDDIGKVIEKKKWPAILGSANFIQKIKTEFFSGKVHEEIPQSRELAPDIYQIKKAVCKYYQVAETELMKSKRGVFNEPRNVAIFLTRRLRGDELKKIGAQFNIKKYSSVSSINDRMKSAIAVDHRLSRRVETVAAALSKSQKQT